MPIWLELLVLLLVAYGVGMGIGWIIWAETAQAQQRGENEQ